MTKKAEQTKRINVEIAKEVAMAKRIGKAKRGAERKRSPPRDGYCEYVNNHICGSLIGSDRVVRISKAQRMTSDADPVPGIVIQVMDEIGSGDTAGLDDDARALADALGAVLPGGTMDRLLVRLLERRINDLAVLVVPAAGKVSR